MDEEKQACLAINGGPRLRGEPFPPRGMIGWEEKAAVDAVLERAIQSGNAPGYHGEEEEAYCREFAAYLGGGYSDAVSSGTAAVYVALKALDLEPFSEVIVGAMTDPGGMMPIPLLNLIPMVADTSPGSFNSGAEQIEELISPRTSAILIPHIGGEPADIEGITRIANRRGLPVIEDCAQAHGARYRGRVVGSIGHVGTFSFCQDKIMSTGGEGGMLVTGIREVWARAWMYKDHGKSLSALQPPAESWKYRWLHDTIGTNMRMTEMQAAIGRVQLGKLDRWLARRAENARVFEAAFGDLAALRLTPSPPHVRHAYYKYYAFIRPERLKSGWDRDRILQVAQSQGLSCFSGSCGEIYRERCFADAAQVPSGPLPVARALGETSLMTLVHPTLAIDEVHHSAAGLAAVIRTATA